jgi:hypothetical protein
MTPEKEINVRIAKLLGLEVFPMGQVPDVHYFTSSLFGPVAIPPYSTDMTAAWRVVDWMKSKGFTLTLFQGANGRSSVLFSNSLTPPGAAVTDLTFSPFVFAHAICLAALKALDAS